MFVPTYSHINHILRYSLIHRGVKLINIIILDMKSFVNKLLDYIRFNHVWFVIKNNSVDMKLFIVAR